MANMIAAAIGALKSNVTFAASLNGRPSTTQFVDSSLNREISFHAPCINNIFFTINTIKILPQYRIILQTIIMF